MMGATNIIRQILWASVAVMAATGAASAQTSFLAGRVLEDSVYYASPQDAISNRPLGRLLINTHVCIKGPYLLIVQNRYFEQVILPSGKMVITEPFNEKTGVRARIGPDVANNKACQANAAQSTTQAKATVPGNGNSVPNPDGATDSVMRANIADMAEFYRSYVPSHFIPNVPASYYRVIVNDPQAKNLTTKYAIAMGFFAKARYTGNYDGWLYDDHKFNDLQTARQWFQMVVKQIEGEYPNIRNNALRFQSDPSGAIASMLNVSETNIVFCPTALERKQTRARAEQQRAAQQREAEAKKEQPTRYSDGCERLKRVIDSGALMPATATVMKFYYEACVTGLEAQGIKEP